MTKLIISLLVLMTGVIMMFSNYAEAGVAIALIGWIASQRLTSRLEDQNQNNNNQNDDSL